MKKTYIAPVLELTKMNDADIIATSFGANDFTSAQDLLSREALDFEQY